MTSTLWPRMQLRVRSAVSLVTMTRSKKIGLQAHMSILVQKHLCGRIKSIKFLKYCLVETIKISRYGEENNSKNSSVKQRLAYHTSPLLRRLVNPQLLGGKRHQANQFAEVRSFLFYCTNKSYLTTFIFALYYVSY